MTELSHSNTTKLRYDNILIRLLCLISLLLNISDNYYWIYWIYRMSIKNMRNILKKQISMFSEKNILETKVSERFVSETFWQNREKCNSFEKLLTKWKLRNSWKNSIIIEDFDKFDKIYLELLSTFVEIHITVIEEYEEIDIGQWCHPSGV